MLKKIKNFFKWIAKKVSSGWNWLFSSKANTAPKNTSSKRPSGENVNKSNTVPTVSTPMQNETEEPASKADTNVEPAENFPEKSNDEPKAVGELKFDGEKLLLVTTSDQFAKCKDYRNTQSANSNKLLMFIKCGANEYRIIGDSTGDSTKESISIKSILRKNKNGDYIDGNILRVEEEILSVKKMLGLEIGTTNVKVDSISNQPFKGTALEQHNLNPITAQQDEKGTKPSPTVEVPEAQISNLSKVGNDY